jgi:hypothetical protein
VEKRGRLIDRTLQSNEWEESENIELQMTDDGGGGGAKFSLFRSHHKKKEVAGTF